MSRKSVERRRVRLVVRDRAELEAERDQLLAVVADCRSSECPCHTTEWADLEAVRFLLGEEAGS